MGTLTRRLSAVGKAHQLAGHADPTDDAAVPEVLRGLRQQNGSASAAHRHYGPPTSNA